MRKFDRELREAVQEALRMLKDKKWTATSQEQP
jgi:hypothetical protein